MGLFGKAKDQMNAAREASAQLGGGFGSAAAAAQMGDANTINASGAEMRRLWDVGLDGTAIIKAANDTGERLAGNVVLDLDLVVTIAGGEPYDVTHRMTIAGTDTGPYAPGSQYNVKVDPEDRGNLTFSA